MKLKRRISICLLAACFTAVSLSNVLTYVGGEEFVPNDYVSANATISLKSSNHIGIYEESTGEDNEAIQVMAVDGDQIYKSNNNNFYMRVDNESFMQAEAISIEPDNYTEFKTIASEKGLSDALLDDIDNIMAKVNSGQIELEKPLVVYTPTNISLENDTKSGIIDAGNSTYTGYGNRQYYQELLRFSGTTESFPIIKPESTWVQYRNKVFKAIVNTTIDEALDFIMGSKWTLLSIVLQSTSDSIPTTTSCGHSAILVENKYRKYTYVVQDNERYLGSVTDYTYDTFFKNLITVPGVDAYFVGDSPPFSAKSEGYDNADEYAYYNYLNSAYNNRIEKYVYENESLNIPTFVDSQY